MLEYMRIANEFNFLKMIGGECDTYFYVGLFFTLVIASAIIVLASLTRKEESQTLSVLCIGNCKQT